MKQLLARLKRYLSKPKNPAFDIGLTDELEFEKERRRGVVG